MELKITKGEWIIEFSHIGKKCAYSIKGFSGNANEDIANAKLIVDAGNTTNKCGLLPSELLEQRNELLDACKTLIQQAEMCNYHTSDGMHALLDNLAIKKVRIVIEKATNKTNVGCTDSRYDTESSNDILEALVCLMKEYKDLADSGDCGNWKAEEQKEYIKAQEAIKKTIK